ncbi:hypothetical protein [uncultured Sphingomonas sp.]|uniref:hypothetical protein n=1 Tax=uncultured Sphingomonas sp. TaxID=158754 RepID=UPI0035CBFA52
MAKTKKAKIPKRIAGVKLPRELRRTGEAILERANSPQGREMLAAGLTMAAAAATAAVARSRAAAAAPKDAGPGEAGKPGTDPMAFATALGGMAEAALGTFFAAKKPG